MEEKNTSILDKLGVDIGLKSIHSKTQCENYKNVVSLIHL